MTQALCAVCAVSFDDVRAIAGRLASRPRVISLDPETLAEVLSDLSTLAEAAGEPERGDELLDRLGERLDAVAAAVDGEPRPRVAALEWLDPVYIGGHWVPEMVELAGGVDALGRAAVKSRVAEWGEIEAASPDIVVAMPCGLYAPEAAAQARAHGERLRGARRQRGVRGRRRLLVLPPRPAAGRRRRAARPPPSPGAGRGPAEIAFERPWDPDAPVRSRPRSLVALRVQRPAGA